jgi:hypothetical protein
VVPSIDFTIVFDESPTRGVGSLRVCWRLPGALSQGRTRAEARENVLEALRTVLTPDDELVRSTVTASQRTQKAHSQNDEPERLAQPEGYRLGTGQSAEDVLAIETELLRSEGIDPTWPGFETLPPAGQS